MHTVISLLQNNTKNSSKHETGIADI